MPLPEPESGLQQLPVSPAHTGCSQPRAESRAGTQTAPQTQRGCKTRLGTRRATSQSTHFERVLSQPACYLCTPFAKTPLHPQSEQTRLHLFRYSMHPSLFFSALARLLRIHIHRHSRVGKRSGGKVVEPATFLHTQGPHLLTPARLLLVRQRKGCCVLPAHPAEASPWLQGLDGAKTYKKERESLLS